MGQDPGTPVLGSAETSAAGDVSDGFSKFSWKWIHENHLKSLSSSNHLKSTYVTYPVVLIRIWYGAWFEHVTKYLDYLP
jgi:hypothetical protein